MARLPDLDALRLLVEVAGRGSIGAAARESGISQQAASERLRSVEAETGLSLLQRGPGGSTLTPAGRLVVEWSTGLLAHADEVEHAMAALRTDRSRELHIYASMTTAEHLVPRWLVRLRQQGSVSVSMVATNTVAVVAAVRAGDADVGFIEGPADLSGLNSRSVGEDRLVLVAAPEDPWGRRRTPLTPAEIAARPLTSRESGSGTRRVAEEAFVVAGHPLAPPEVALTTNAAVLAAVRAGSPPALLGEAALSGVADVLVLPVSGVDLTRQFSAIWSGGPRPPAGPLRDLLAIAGRGG